MQINELIELALNPRKSPIHIGESGVDVGEASIHLGVEPREARVHLRVEPRVPELSVQPLFDKRRVHLVEPLVHLVEALVHRRGRLIHFLLERPNTPGKVVNPVSHASAFPRVYHRPQPLRCVSAAQAGIRVERMEALRAE